LTESATLARWGKDGFAAEPKVQHRRLVMFKMTITAALQTIDMAYHIASTKSIISMPTNNAAIATT